MIRLTPNAEWRSKARILLPPDMTQLSATVGSLVLAGSPRVETYDDVVHHMFPKKTFLEEPDKSSFSNTEHPVTSISSLRRR